MTKHVWASFTTTPNRVLRLNKCWVMKYKFLNLLQKIIICINARVIELATFGLRPRIEQNTWRILHQ
ncbi:hypothetical protein EGI26_12795 [Lacihabitans sp. CCS-44]|nr:hypothetical protein [Lacihabitans sp. CCS-44]